MDIHKVILKLLLELPFYGYVASGISPVKTTSVKTIRMVSIPERKLYYHPDWFASLSEEHQMGAVMHELLHLILLHPFRRGERELKLWSVACDIAVNELLPGHYLAADAVTADGISAKLKRRLEPGKTAEYYYEKLSEGEELFSFFALEGDSIVISEGNQSLRADLIPDESGSQTEVKALKQEIADTLEEAGANGELPPELQSIAWEVYREYRLNWRILLKRFLTGRGKIVVRKSYKRQSRRYENLPGTKRSIGVHALLAIDESGSISDNSVMQFYRELLLINRITGVSIQVTRFDTKCSDPVSLSSFITEHKREKRGGTDFRPVFTLADELRIPLVILFTDGEGQLPDSVNQKTLWVLTKRPEHPMPFGVSVLFEEAN